MEYKTNIAVIGGSGVYQLDGVKILDTVRPGTPFGEISDEITIAEVEGVPVAFLPRHGKGHRLSPTELPVKAIMWALKYLGIEQIISISAVGSLKENIAPTEFVIPSQIIDRTRNRENTFFGNGVVGHIGFAEPFCPEMQDILFKTIKAIGIPVHDDETIVCMEGPAFSTKAESFLYKSWGAGIIGMTALPEAKLAREAEMCYATIAMVTDYDCWHEEEDEVSVEMVLNHMKTNTVNVKKVIPEIVKRLNDTKLDCSCNNAAEFAIMTKKEHIPIETKKKLGLFYGKYWD